MKRLLFDLKLYYYFFIIFGVAAGFLGYYLTSFGINLPPIGIGLIIEYALVAMVAVLIGITCLSMLVMPHVWVKKLGDTAKMRKYKKLASMQIILLGAGLMFCAAMYFILWQPKIVLAATAINLIALLFCYPSATRIINKLQLTL